MINSKRITYYDVLNILAIFAVICMHCNGGVHVWSDTWTWKFNMLVETLCYWAVPAFFMLSGATLMNYRERYTTKDFFKKRLLRTFIPFVIWSIIGAIYFRVNPLEIGFVEFINKFLNTTLMAQIFWFFPCLFTVYLAMPALSLLKDNKNVLWYLVIGGFILNSLLPWLLTFVGIKWNMSFNMQLVAGSIIYALLGYLFSTHQFHKREKTLIYILMAIAILLRYFGTLYLSKIDGSLNLIFWGDINQIPLSCGIFLIFKNNKFINDKLSAKTPSRVLKKLSSCSLGIYLSHYIILLLTIKFIPLHPILSGAIFPFVVYAISLILVLILKKIPVLKYIVP